MTAQSIAHLAPADSPGVGIAHILPDGAIVRRVTDVCELAIETPAALVVLSGETSAALCPAVQAVSRLRTHPDLTVATRSCPVVVLSDYPLHELLTFDPKFLPLASPGVALIAPPHSRDRVTEALSGLPPADTARALSYLDVEGRLAKLRDQSRHRLANALGPRVLIESARAAGAIDDHMAADVAERVRTAGPPDPLAAEYAHLLELTRPSRPSVTRRRGRRFDPGPNPVTVLLLDDDRTAGWPETLAGVLGLEPAAAVRADIAMRGYRRGGFRLDCWAGTDLEALLSALCPATEDGYERFTYDAVLLDLRLKAEAPSLGTRELSGYQALERIHRADPTVQVVLFTASKNALHVRELLDREATGYYLKEEALPDPPADNFVRLSASLGGVLKNLDRREAFWSLWYALGAAGQRPWYDTDQRPDEVEKLWAAVEHLQALVVLRETALPEVLDLRLRRHFIDSAHAVMDAALRLQNPRLGAAETGALVFALPQRTTVRSAAMWLNDTRNMVMHPGNRRQASGGPHDHLVAVSAACVVLSEGAVTGANMFQWVDARGRPAWL